MLAKIILRENFKLQCENLIRTINGNRFILLIEISDFLTKQSDG